MGTTLFISSVYNCLFFMVTDGTRIIYYHLPMCEIFYHARFIWSPFLYRVL